jgi:hypothetical protein
MLVAQNVSTSVSYVDHPPPWRCNCMPGACLLFHIIDRFSFVCKQTGEAPGENRELIYKYLHRGECDVCYDLAVLHYTCRKDLWLWLSDFASTVVSLVFARI